MEGGGSGKEEWRWGGGGGGSGGKRVSRFWGQVKMVSW